MITTPIFDFVQDYKLKNATRMHMPGHKGMCVLGCEDIDITEIDGADSLYNASGIIKSSEQNASDLFGCHTFYSTEGSSQCIKAMLYLATINNKSNNKPLIFAARNVHTSFLSVAALLDLDVQWLYEQNQSSYLKCVITAEKLESALQNAKEMPCAVYLTNPDYLGNMCDIYSISKVCKKYGVLLLVDNAHGAYLKFLPKSLHPMDLGADMCSDSAHKTLPVLTGGAYLHINKNVEADLVNKAKTALSLFGSTSPSYLILQSLDLANKYLYTDFKNDLISLIKSIDNLKSSLLNAGYTLLGDEPLKITINANKYGYTGAELAKFLNKNNVFCEFYDASFLVLMLTPQTSEKDLLLLEKALLSIPQRQEIACAPPVFNKPQRVLSIRNAVFEKSEILPLKECLGKTLASVNLPCPPAVPILVSGEKIDQNAIEIFKYYGINTLSVI
ncbi:MAG: aminotransferase class I/II-fold pyridoxal phosphate-dependent enzyme [Clostridia bacterium]|nr:aminotransferase class I/II-fold pyridoxal phosphate-dependent enzyme [Clostridia bacterium]